MIFLLVGLKRKVIPYNFDLLYRASRDGNTAASFHRKCDNKGPTIVIAKITNSQQIVGGYTVRDKGNRNHVFINCASKIN